jgi:AcrR family transcriptional regulator
MSRDAGPAAGEFFAYYVQRTPKGLPMTETGGPASIWDLPERGTRGPKPRHDRATIAKTAVRIADAEGLDGLTMRRVAHELGIATMSLYNYVPAKDHLAQLMIDYLSGEYRYPEQAGPDRRLAIAELAGQAREIARRHPWLPELAYRTRLAPGPQGLRYLDYFLGLLADSDLDTGGKLEVISMISGFATMYGGTQAARAAAASGQPDAGAQIQPFARAAQSGHYPHLAAALATAAPPRSEDEVFESCLARLIEAAQLR